LSDQKRVLCCLFVCLFVFKTYFVLLNACQVLFLMCNLQFSSMDSNPVQC
jgi:hypothetical protein